MGRIPLHARGGERKQQIRRLSERHRCVCRLLVQGMKVGDVAHATGYCREQISTISNSTVGRDYINRLHDERDREAVRARLGRN